MKKIKENIHWQLFGMGVLLLLAGIMLGWTRFNAVLIASLLLILSGTVLYVRHIKRQSNY